MKNLFKFFSKPDVCTLLVNQEGRHVDRYRRFKDFLNFNQAALGLLAELEQLHFSGLPFTSDQVREKSRALLGSLEDLLQTFRALVGDKFNDLEEVFQRIRGEVEKRLDLPRVLSHDVFILPLEEIAADQVRLVGAKAGNLGLINNKLGLPVPPGFAITAAGARYFLSENGLEATITKLLSRLAPEQADVLDEVCRKIQQLIRKAPVPPALQAKILQAYQALEERTRPEVLISLRSSAIGEDSEATFAGQFVTVLNLRREDLLEAYKTVLASKYSPRAVWYRWQRGLEDEDLPMAVAGLVMVRPKASGVLYTVDPSEPGTGQLVVSAIWGLGEELVGGQTVPDSFGVDRQSLKITARTIARKERRLVGLPEGGTRSEEVPLAESEQPALTDDTLLLLADYGLRLEAFFGSPQDVEWAQDPEGRLYILQSRPLHFHKSGAASPSSETSIALPVIFSGGQTASPGLAAGPAWVLKSGADLSAVPEGVILVAPTASPNYARLAGRVKGLVTEMGSITSHLASVAREFSIPFIVGAGGAGASIPHGALVTLEADSATIYQGIDETRPATGNAANRPFWDSPVSRRLRDLLNVVAPLNLTDPQASSFSPDGCRTVHDLIRFTHEWAMKEMFGLGGTLDRPTVSVRMKTGIPLIINLIDLGGGLQTGLTDCDAIGPDHIASLPMKALWKGFTHPGITWKGTVQFDPKSFLSLMASSATSEFGAVPGGESYAFLSRDYLNLSIRFGYHFANLDVLCGDQGSQNYISLQFSGGAGNFLGRSLRILFLEMVLRQLGFEVSVQGDILEATLAGYDHQPLEEKLDQLGRLLASTRLLDMALTRPEDVERLTDLFFRGDYDFLSRDREGKLPGFYIQEGDWDRKEIERIPVILQDGSRAGFQVSTGMAKLLGKVTGSRLQDFLDRMEAYYYFPLIIAKDSELAGGTVSVEVKTIGGHIDRAGGIAFGLRSLGNYFVWRLNALEDNLILFEYTNHKRIQRAEHKNRIDSDTWYALQVELAGGAIRAYLDSVLILTYETETPLAGYAGLWTKADSVTLFRNWQVNKK
ncbi:MAG: pyruvate, phosphate dikinase [Deltaproteobacteria bacterium]|nr:pyruvate, phosphate dikinase [Deltaproteobacteria bacterium]